MKKTISALILITIVMSSFAAAAWAMIPVAAPASETTLLFESTDLATFNSNAGSFISSTYDTDYKNGVAVTGIGGKPDTDESIQVFSRVKTAGSDNFRLEFNLLKLAESGKPLYGSIETASDGLQWFNTDIVHEFKIMPNRHITKMAIGDRSNTFAAITGLSTTEWTDVKIIVDSDNMTSYTFVNGVLHTTNTRLSKGSSSSPAVNYIRISGYTIVPDEFQEQSEVQKDADVYFYFDDYKFSKTTAAKPTVYINQTESFNLTKGSRITTGGGSNSVVGGVYGKASADKVLEMITSADPSNTTSWYGYPNTDTPVVTDLTTTTVDTIYETSFAVPEDVISVKLCNNAVIVAFDNNSIRKNQWNKVKAVYSHATSKWTIYLNGKYYGQSSAALEGRYKLQIDTPVGQSDTMYADSIRIYQAAAETENFEEATLMLPEVYETEKTERVSDIKAALGIKAADNAVFYSDHTYTATLSDSDLVADGTVIVAQNSNEVFQYCVIKNIAHGSVAYSGSAKYSDTQFTTGTMSVKAYSDVDAKLYVAQYDTDGKIIDIRMSETKSGAISLDYEPVDADGKLKIFLWDAEYQPISESIVLDYKRSMDVLIVGNSFSRDTLFYTRDIAEEFDIDITMGLAYNGGKDLKWHYDNREADALAFYLNEFGGSAIKSNVSLQSILTDASYDWDVIILQNYISNTSSGVSDTIWEKGVDIAKYVNNLVPDAEIKLNMIWSNEIGYSGTTSAAIQDTTDEYLRTKNDQLAAAIKTELNLDYDVEVVPVGTAIATARDYVDEEGLNVFGATYYRDGYVELGNRYVNDKNNRTHYYGYGVMSDEEKNAGMIKINRDGFHLTPIARYLASAVWFESLTGQSIMDSTFAPPADTNLGCLVCPTDDTAYYLYGTFAAPDAKYVNVMKDIAHNAQ